MISWLAGLERPSGLPAVWLLDLNDRELRRLARALAPTPDDLSRAASRPPTEREDVLVRRGLVRLCVAAALEVRASEVIILWSPRGAPLLGPPFADYRVSWAQRAGRFACALSLQPIGVDIEIADGGEIPRKALHAQEIAVLRAAEPFAREALFLRIWAAKEAYAKALGEGLRRETSEFALHLERDGAGFIEDSQAADRKRVRVAFAPIAGVAGVVAVALGEK
ncbi:MAG: 4'-phosphopantetheinyl transferase family protein [Hyphomicrobiales bacterium]